MDKTIEIRKTADNTGWYAELPLQSPDICDLCDEYGYTHYRSDWRESYGVQPLLVSDTDRARLERFISASQSLIVAAENYLRDEDARRDRDEQEEQERWKQHFQAVDKFERENPDRVITITRRSRVGWGYNTQPSGNGTEIEPTTGPDYVGTVKTVIDQRNNDPVLQSLQSTHKTTAWFVRVRGEWKKIKYFSYDICNLIDYTGPKYGYMEDSITVHI